MNKLKLLISIIFLLISNLIFADNNIFLNITYGTKNSVDFFDNINENQSQISGLNYKILDNKDNIIYIGKSSNYLDKINLNYGDYKINIKDKDGKENILSFTLENNTLPLIRVQIQKDFIQLKGSIKSNNNLIGDVKIEFESSTGDKYSFISDIEGNFIGRIPVGKYKVNINKIGYMLDSSTQTYYDYRVKYKTYTPVINLQQIPSKISGFIYDEKLNPVKAAKLEIKNASKMSVVFTDNNGMFETDVDSGIIFIRASKKGHYPTGLIRKIESYSTIKNVQLILDKIYGQINGVITDGQSPIINTKVDLYESTGKYVGTFKTNKKGYYEFNDIQIYKSYYLHLPDKKFKDYKSDIVFLEEVKTKTFDLLIGNYKFHFIIELESNRAISNLDIIVNGKKFKTDLNGIVDNSFNSNKKINEINISIPKYNINKKYKIDSKQKPPHLFIINF